jgi:hypothetical protein
VSAFRHPSQAETEVQTGDSQHLAPESALHRSAWISMSAPLPLASGSATPSRSRDAAWTWLQAQLAGRPLPAALTVIGLGDLSLLAALDSRSPETKVLALEPDPEVARQTLARDDIQAWRRSGRLVYLSAPDYAGADQAWRIFPARFEQPPLMVHPASAAATGVRGAVQVLAKIVFGAKANAAARRLFAPRYLTNSLRNLPAMLAGRDVRELSGVAQDRPAVVVGAGPSLDASIADLKRLGSRAVVIATDTALRPLLSAGVVPQFVIALDPSEMNGRHLLDLPECRGTWLVAESALDPAAVSAFTGRTFWFRVAPHQPWPWLNDLGVDAGRLDVWGSVLTAGFQLACLAGCDPIVMTGADLSFPGGRPYARGTTYEFDWAWAAAFGAAVEETWRSQLASRKELRVERDLTGADVPTTGVMIEFRDWVVAQARKGGRRVINASAQGLLMGDGVEQASLSDVLGSAQPVPVLFDQRERSRAEQTPAIAEALRRVCDSLAAGALDTAPLAAWQEFSGDGFDAARLAGALGEARRALESATAGHAEVLPARHAALGSLPEALVTLRSALAGIAPPQRDLSSGDRAERMIVALERVTRIIEQTSAGGGIESLADSRHVGTVPAGALVPWPRRIRWAALEVEALLAAVWHHAVPPARIVDPATLHVVPTEAGGAGGGADEGRIKAAHACLLLVLEWLACAASLGGAGGVRSITDRLYALKALLRRSLWHPPAAGPEVELVARASAGGRDAELRLPLGLSSVAVTRVMTGTMRAGGDHAWDIGTATSGDLSVHVAMQVTAGAPALTHRARATAMTARPVASGSRRPLKVAGHAPGGALAVVDFTAESWLIRADGTVEPYQSWPRPISGVLSLGEHGDVAWSNVWQPQHGRTPFLLYRPAPGAEVVAFELPFRPARGIWWRDRLYLTCLPTRDFHGGVAAWAPGERPAIVLRDLPLQGIVPAGDELWLEPFVPGTPQVVARQRAERGWRWTPGGAAEVRSLGPLGAASDVAAAGEWTATAYPQADVVVLAHRDGTCLELCCHNPLRVAWAAGSLIVSGAEGETLLFERLLDTIGVR